MATSSGSKKQRIYEIAKELGMSSDVIVQIAKKLGAELGRLGFCVVSGLARGIDTAAHEGALEGGGVTAAVLGTGIDIIYPPENLALDRGVEGAGADCRQVRVGRRRGPP